MVINSSLVGSYNYDETINNILPRFWRRTLTLSLPWEMSYFCETATVNPYTNCNTPTKRFYLWHCINHSS